MTVGGSPVLHRHPIAVISSSWSPTVTTSPTALPIRRLATGETKEIELIFRSASSSPTIR